jgi:hypothetical protein
MRYVCPRYSSFTSFICHSYVLPVSHRSLVGPTCSTHYCYHECQPYVLHEALVVSVAEPKAEEPKLNCLLEAEPKLRIATPAPEAPVYLSKTLKNSVEKNYGCKRSFVNYHKFNPIWVQHASIM